MNIFWLFFVLLFLFVALFLVLVERKCLAVSQRRIGPILFFRNGIFQIIFDMLKLLSKEACLLPQFPLSGSLFSMCLCFCILLVFSNFLIFGPNLFSFDDCSVFFFYQLLLTIFSSLFLFLAGMCTYSKYAILGSVRVFIHILSFDVVYILVLLFIFLCAQSFNQHDVVIIQIITPFFLLFLPFSFIFLIFLLFESKRSPFDHIENESELVAGYTVEYNSYTLLIILLCEYLHIIIAAIQFVVLFFAGWYLLFYNIMPYVCISNFYIFYF